MNQSGSPLADWAALEDVYRMDNTSRVYGERLGCVTNKPYKLIECLRTRSFEEMGNVRFTVSSPLPLFYRQGWVDGLAKPLQDHFNTLPLVTFVSYGLS